MPAIDLVVSTPLSDSIRARQVCAMFDVPPTGETTLSWSGAIPFEDKPWNVGLIVGPSGCGKSSIMREVFGEQPDLAWAAPSVLDDFRAGAPVAEITNACGAVGFNTIPAWLRPYRVLSNGERFRVDLARRIVELPDPVVVDEFTSVVDRQVAKIGSHAVAKWARRGGRQFVAVSCHYDIIDWLQPDWVLEPATMKFAWRSVQPRPQLRGWVERVPYSTWAMFAPYHYLTAKLHLAARCFGLFIEGVPHPVAFVGCLHRPHPTAHDIMGNSRTVCLPDYQGLGLAFLLMETLGAAYKGIGKRFHSYPAHPSFVRAFARTGKWRMVKKPGKYLQTQGLNKNMPGTRKSTIVKVSADGTVRANGFGGRPCAVFCYDGPAMDADAAKRLIG